MKAKQTLLILLAISIIGLSQAVSAQIVTSNQHQTMSVKTDSRMVYHNGPVLTESAAVYAIWYGCWTNNCGIAGDSAYQFILTDFLSSIGSTPYLQINSTYPDSVGRTPNGTLFFGGSAVDPFSHGFDLTASDIQGIISDQILTSQLPLDPSAIYLVLASADVSSTATGFCVPAAFPHHGYGEVLGTKFRYAFVGNPVRCPSIGASQFFANGTQLPTPNGNLGADAMASTIAHVLSTLITNPYGSGWFDRYGLENADKCEGQFGQTYLTANGARGNLRLGQRDFLIQENWVNDRKGRCAMRL